MSIELLGLVTIALGLVVLAVRPVWAFSMMLASTVFGAAAAITLPSLGGASILVPNLFLVFYCLRLFLGMGEGPALAALRPPHPGFWLFILIVFGVVSAFFLPALFQGEIQTMAVSRVVGARNIIALTPLRFSSNNITQTVYAVGGLACFAFTAAYCRRPDAHADLIRALLVVASVDLVFALADVVTYSIGRSDLLDFIHTANYALLTDSEKGGLKRISGTFSEASAFGGYTVMLFAAVMSLWLDHVRARWTGPLAGLLFLSLIFSTSATALVGLAAVLPFLALRSLVLSARLPGQGRPAFLLAATAALPLVALSVPVLFPEVAQAVSDYLDEILFSKVGSQSGTERFMWNSMAYRTFVDSWGIGAGLGSARASSYALVLLSNVGILGTALYILFFGAILSARPGIEPGPSREHVAAMRAAKAGALAVLIAQLTSGTVFDVGLAFYVLTGSVAGLSMAAVARDRFTPRAAPLQAGTVTASDVGR